MNPAVGIAGIVGLVVHADPAQSQVLMPAPMPFMLTWVRLNADLAAGRQNGGQYEWLGLRSGGPVSVLWVLSREFTPGKPRCQTVASGRVLDGRVGRDRTVLFIHADDFFNVVAQARVDNSLVLHWSPTRRHGKDTMFGLHGNFMKALPQRQYASTGCIFSAASSRLVAAQTMMSMVDTIYPIA